MHLSSPVRWVRWAQREMKVHTDDAEARADAVVVAVPASVVEEIKFEPPLGEQKVDAHRSVRYGQAAKLFVPLRAPAPPSQVLSVPGRWWCYTQLGADGEPLPFVAAFAGSPRAIEALDLGNGPGSWADDLARLRPDLELDSDEAMISTWDQDPWVRGAYSARSAIVLDRESGAQPTRRTGGVRRRAHRGPLARADGRRAPERPAGRSGAAPELSLAES